MSVRLVGVVSSQEDARSIVFSDSRFLVYQQTEGGLYRILELQ